MRVVVAEDEALLREGLTLLLGQAGIEVVAAVGNARSLITSVLRLRPDLVVTDIRMPPQNTDDGLRAALQLRQRIPDLRVMLLSQHVSKQYAIDLLESGPAGTGYLLKQRVADAKRFAVDVRTVGNGGTVIDSDLASAAMARAEHIDVGVKQLTEKQQEVMSLLAQGRSNAAIAQSLFITEKSVVEHVSNIYGTLQIPQTGDENRRVLAVLQYLST